MGTLQGANNEQWTPSMGKLIQLVIILDCTGSMASEMAAVKKAVLSVVDEMHAKMTESAMKSDDLSKNITVEFSLIAYRDYTDTPACADPLPFGGPDVVRAAIEAEIASGGGDDPECVELALHYAETRLQWEYKADKMMLLVTDAPPHAQGVPGDSYPNGAPSQYECPDIWTTVDRLAERGVCMTVCGCREFQWNRRTPTIYELMARKTNGRLVRFEAIEAIECGLASYLGTAALEEDFVQNVLGRVGRMNLSDDEYNQVVDEAMEGMQPIFRSLGAEEYAMETFFDVTKFDNAKNSEQVDAAFRSLVATADYYGSPAFRPPGGADDGGEPVYRSLCSGGYEDSPMLPPAKAMRSAPPVVHKVHVTTTRDRLRRRP